MCHPYHIVDESPWPLFGAIGGLYFTTGIVAWFHKNEIFLFLLGMTLLIIVIIQWWRERAIQGIHTSIVELGLRWGIALSFFQKYFLLVFLSFFHRRLSPNVLICGGCPLSDYFKEFIERWLGYFAIITRSSSSLYSILCIYYFKFIIFKWINRK